MHAVCASVSQKRLLISPHHFRAVKHAAKRKSMYPELSAITLHHGPMKPWLLPLHRHAVPDAAALHAAIRRGIAAWMHYHVRIGQGRDPRG